MKKNLYYRHITGRENIIKSIVLGLAMGLSSYPRLLLEVFIRKDFGERYFNFASTVTLAVILAVLPFLKMSNSSATDFLLHDFTYYAYLVLFVLFSFWHEKDLKRSSSAFDFQRYSLYSGTVHPYFYTIQLPWQKSKADIRTIETLLEPAPFFIAGVVLCLLQQKLGILLTTCSVVYALSYLGAYASGDAFVLDKIDEMIANDELEKSFVDGAAVSDTKGFQFRGRKPASEEMRRRVLPLMTEENETQKEETYVAN